MILSNIINLSKNIELYSLYLGTAEYELTGVKRRTITIFKFFLYTTASLTLQGSLFKLNCNRPF